MCGIAGFLDAGSRETMPYEALLSRLTDTIANRGPDDAGAWADAERGVALGHRRLSILDLSPDGHQPMTSASGRFVMVYNGEVYNFADLARTLEGKGHRFRGHSDTEVMLASIEEWGIEASLERFIGMFAFALWDRETRTLTLARDRFGIKPLYYGTQAGVFLFGSELSALAAHPAFGAEIDRDALADFLRMSYVPAPRTIYTGIRKLRPGHALTVCRDGDAVVLDERPYWSLEATVAAARADPFTGTDDAALDAVLRDAVRLRMIADVPLGAFLSGGIDSSLVVALMQAQASQPVKTFTIGFADAAYDESPHARAVAAHLGTDHTELTLGSADVLSGVAQLGAMYDEPFGDSSALPTFLVSALARDHVTVSLSGDGGDELFGGYNRHLEAPRLWRALARVPLGARRAAARALGALARRPDLVDRLNASAPARLRVRTPATKLAKLAGVVAASSENDVYRRLVTVWDAPEGIVRGGQATWAPPSAPWLDALGGAERMMALDALTYLPDDILTKVDRASMAVSLEARVPLLDHRVAALAWRLPLAMKIRDGEKKWLLRRVLDRYVPRAIMERPKMGFALPLGDLLRGPLRPWADDLLAPDRLDADGLLDPAAVARLRADHDAGHPAVEYGLWNVLMFQAWRDATRTEAAASVGASGRDLRVASPSDALPGEVPL